MQTETTFDKVYLYSCLSCPDGYFDILSGSYPSNYPMNFNSGGQYLTVHFQTDGTGQRSGFNANVKFIDPPTMPTTTGKGGEFDWS